MIRERIEGQLKDHELDSLTEWCRRQRVPREEWPRHRGAYGWLDLAVHRAVDAALRSGRARSRTAALRLIAGDLGIPSGDSIRRRWERRAA
jgi:hypothetical protein